MPGRTIGTHVSFLDYEAGKRIKYMPGDSEDDMPPSHVKRLDNPKVWAKPLDIGLSNVTFDSAPPNYMDMTVPELLEKVKQRNLNPESPRKADIIIALTQADNAEIRDE